MLVMCYSGKTHKTLTSNMQEVIKTAWPGALVDAETLQYELWGEVKYPADCKVITHEPDSFNRGGITVTFGGEKTNNGANMAIVIALPDGVRRLEWYKVTKEFDTQRISTIIHYLPDNMKEEWLSNFPD